MAKLPDPVEHWERVYSAKETRQTSWYQESPEPSSSLITSSGVSSSQPLVDIGGGASTLVDDLLRKGHSDITVLDIANAALKTAQTRLGDLARSVTWEVQDVRAWQPRRTYRLWHDRAVFHFLTEPEDQAAYKRTLLSALDADGVVIIASFAKDGPERCSNLDVARYEPDELASEFSPAFNLIHSAKHDHETPWGDQQPFSWCTLRRRPSGD
jgi:trans-aconitate methyltransferase